MPADYPFDRDVDAEHAQALRDRSRQTDAREPGTRSLVALRRELRRAGGVGPAGRRLPIGPPPTERIGLGELTVEELTAIDRAAALAGLSRASYLRACALSTGEELERAHRAAERRTAAAAQPSRLERVVARASSEVRRSGGTLPLEAALVDAARKERRP